MRASIGASTAPRGLHKLPILNQSLQELAELFQCQVLGNKQHIIRNGGQFSRRNQQ